MLASDDLADLDAEEQLKAIGHDHRVLLVEDSDELVTLLKKGLAQGGFSADAVGTAADADHALSAMRYAAVVLDRGLPDADGLIWLAQGVALRGESPPRLAFLKQILDAAPPEGISPTAPAPRSMNGHGFWRAAPISWT